MKIEDKIRYLDLFNIYEELLTKKQKNYFKLFFDSDLNFNEIATLKNISRQTIAFQIKNIMLFLDETENKLKILNLQKNLQNNNNISKNKFFKILKS